MQRRRFGVDLEYLNDYNSNNKRSDIREAMPIKIAIAQIGHLLPFTSRHVSLRASLIAKHLTSGKLSMICNFRLYKAILWQCFNYSKWYDYKSGDGGLMGWRNDASPSEIIIRNASSIEILRSITYFWEANIRKPDFGLGVVDTKKLLGCLLPLKGISLKSLAVTKPTL